MIESYSKWEISNEYFEYFLSFKQPFHLERLVSGSLSWTVPDRSHDAADTAVTAPASCTHRSAFAPWNTIPIHNAEQYEGKTQI